MSETHFFIRAFLTGIIIAALADVFAVLRGLCKRSIILINFLDAIFWMLAAVAFWIMLYRTGSEGLRGYLLLGVAAGALWKKELKIIIKKATIIWKDHRKVKEGL